MRGMKIKRFVRKARKFFKDGIRQDDGFDGGYSPFDVVVAALMSGLFLACGMMFAAMNVR